MTTHDQKVVKSGQTQGFIENELPTHQSVANYLISSSVGFLNTLYSGLPKFGTPKNWDFSVLAGNHESKILGLSHFIQKF